MAYASKARIRNNTFILAAAAATLIVAAASVPTAYAQHPGQQLDYYQAMPSYTPHGIPIPGHLAAQAMQAQYQQAAYHANMANNNLQPTAESVDGEYYDESYAEGDGGEARGIFAGGGGGWPATLMTAQRYDDHFVHFAADYVYLKRDDSNKSFVLSNFGVSAVPGIADAPALSTGQVGLDDEQGGVRVSAFIDLFYSFDLELSYMGQLEWGGSASVVTAPGPNNLFSLFSGFQGPPDGLTEGATTQSFSYTSDLNNFELNARWRWVHSNQPWTGAWIMGVRYLQLDERFRFVSAADTIPPPAVGGPGVPGGAGDFVVQVDNDLIGLQIGSEFLGAVHSGILVGGDVKAGIYGNRATNATRLTNTFAGTTIEPTVVGQQAAFVAEANLMVVAELGHGMYLRGGYTGLYVDGVSLGPAAFNRSALFGPGAAVPMGGNLLVHGIFGGLGWQY